MSLLSSRVVVCRRCKGVPTRLPYSSDSSKRSPPARVSLEPLSRSQPEGLKADRSQSTGQDEESKAAKEPGAMSRRLEAATEDALLTGGRAARRAIDDAGFDDELKEKLLDKIADAKFRKQYSGAFATAELDVPSSAGEGTTIIAAGRPWTGTEEASDAVLRMLDDSRKPLRPELRGKFKPPKVLADMRIGKTIDRRSPGQRVSAAKEHASVYTSLDMKGISDKGLSDQEKEDLKKQFKDRFQPAARALPNTITGLAALANERIEDAIARGQFKHIPRGMKDERDPRADNPFIDTTEYIMNKMIQRQDIVPPWIEKQQEVTKLAAAFRKRLRNDWKRHVARMVASEGGSLSEQMKRADDYARAEAKWNPRIRNTDDVAIPSGVTDDVVMVKMRQRVQAVEEAQEAVEEVIAEIDSQATRNAANQRVDVSEPHTIPSSVDPEIVREGDRPLPPPYRDHVWEKAEDAYMSLSIKQLNDVTRSYNLMAPDLAKKPYFSLQRELVACYADVAPLVAKEIKERATRPRSSGVPPASGPYVKKADGILGHFGGKDPVRIHLEADEKAYGLREWWRDLWTR